MSRVARIVVPGFPHHITQRGNRRAKVFDSDEDRQAYLGMLKHYAARLGVEILAYCLMSNHVHLVAVPLREDSLSKTLRDTHTVYAMRFNTRTGMSGHVWQGRFYSTVLDDTHLWAAVRYVERNPVHAGLVEQAGHYPWSSAAAHCGLRSDALLSADFPPTGVVEDWAEWLRAPDDPDLAAQIRSSTRTGRPCGSGAFLARLETMLGKALAPAKRGRKPKSGGVRGSHGQAEPFIA